MCGIFGRISKKLFEVDELIQSLKALEYRGYDSWGIGYLSKKKFNIIKNLGSISSYTEKINSKTKIGIAHTRWATHGKVSYENTHPHRSYNDQVVLVHNGIVENFLELKEMLKNQGYEFYGDTDSEVLANLIEYHITQENDIKEGIFKALQRVKGSYAIVGYANDLVFAAANSSPLLIGLSDDGVYLSSDAKSFVKNVEKISAFNDREVAFINSSLEVEFYDIYGGNITKTFEEVDDVNKYGYFEPLNGYDYYTIKEIEEQRNKLVEVGRYNYDIIREVANEINSAYGVFFIASGSSYNACLAASYYFSKYARMHVNVVDASEFEYYKHFLTPKTLVVAVSQSGETADVIEAVKVAKSKGSKVLGITNVYGSTLQRLSDFSLLMHSGTEISVVATKTYTSQLMILIMIIFSLINLSQHIYDRLGILEKAVKEILNEEFELKMKDIASLLRDEEHLYLIGRGINYATALEGALKIKEISYIHAEAFAGGALKHGSIALISPGTWVIAIVPEDETYDEMISNVMEVKSRGGKVIGITTKHNDVFDVEVIVPKIEEFQPIINVIPLQLIAYYLAILRNLNPDKPRNLAKSVTVK